MMILIAIATLCACKPRDGVPQPMMTSRASTDEPPSEEENSGVSLSSLPSVTGMTRVRSNDGLYDVYYRTIPQSVPLNEMFGMELVIVPTSAADGQPSPQIVTADAAMPHHGHGMNHMPSVSRRGDGAYVVQDMLLHMSGYWEIYVDVQRDGVTERAQWSLELQ